MQECLGAATNGGPAPAASPPVPDINHSAQGAAASALESVRPVHAGAAAAVEPAETAALNQHERESGTTGAPGGLGASRGRQRQDLVCPLTQVVCVRLDSVSALHIAPAVVPSFEYVHEAMQRRGACVGGS